MGAVATGEASGGAAEDEVLLSAELESAGCGLESGWAERGVVLDEGGKVLSGIVVRPEGDAHRLGLEEPTEPGALLDYVFGRGACRVVLEVGRRQIGGRLETRWLGTSRRWAVRLDAPLRPARRLQHVSGGMEGGESDGAVLELR